MRRSLTKDYSIILYLQEECDSLLDATIDGDMEVVSTLINDGVDMNAIIGNEVCITVVLCICTDVLSPGRYVAS